MSPDEAIYKATAALAEKRAKGCRACLLKTDGDPGQGWRDMHWSAHLKLARGDVKLVAPILWGAQTNGSASNPPTTASSEQSDGRVSPDSDQTDGDGCGSGPHITP